MQYDPVLLDTGSLSFPSKVYHLEWLGCWVSGETLIAESLIWQSIVAENIRPRCETARNAQELKSIKRVLYHEVLTLFKM